jgi:small conductance mechanosensitive channel
MFLIRFLIVTLFAAAPAFAQAPADPAGDTGKATAEVIDPQVLPAELAMEFEQRIQTIEEQEVAVEQIRQTLAEKEGLMAKLYAGRLDAVWSEMFSETVSLARDLLDQQRAGYDVSKLTAEVVSDLHVFPTDAIDALKRLSGDVVFPTEEMAPAEVAITDQKLWLAIDKFDRILESMTSWLALANDLGIDDQGVTEFVKGEVQETAANRSSFVHLALDNVSVMREAANALPANEEVTSRLAVSEARVKQASKSLQSAVNLMNQLELDSSAYRQQLVKTTGELSSDLLNVGVMSGIVSEWTAATADVVVKDGPQLIFRGLMLIAILLTFYYLGRAAQAVTRRGLRSSGLGLSALLTEMIIKWVRNIIMIIGVLIALAQIGISVGPLLAGLGIAGFIIGFALQDTLANFASGMLILFYRPFDVGDFVTAGGVTGKVNDMSLVNTTFTTIDNQLLVVPNNLIWKDVITNVTAQQIRRVDLVFGVAYSDDVDKVEQVLAEIVDAHELVLDDPEPVIKLHELADSSVNFICRPWVKTEDYWQVYWDLLRTVKLRFDAEGITIPFPQREVHAAQSLLTAEAATPVSTPESSKSPEPDASEPHADDPPPSDVADNEAPQAN